MRKSSILWLMLLFVWVSLGTYLCHYYLCDAHGSSLSETSESKEIEGKIAEKPQLGHWQFEDGEFNVTVNDFFEFFKNDSSHIPTIKAELENEIESTVNYLNMNPGRMMTIIGYYAMDEVYDGQYQDLGWSRAVHIQKYLVDLGAPSNQLKVTSRLQPQNWFYDGVLKKGVDFEFSELEDTGMRLEEIKSILNAEPIIIFFKKDDWDVYLEDEQSSRIADLAYYLDQVDESIIKIKGHSDDTGNTTLQKRNSNKRAVAVKDYFLENSGIPSDKMEARGYGASRPLADNATEEGKAQNRRVEIILE